MFWPHQLVCPPLQAGTMGIEAVGPNNKHIYVCVIMAAKNCRKATSPGGDPGLQAQPLLLPTHLEIDVTLTSPCTARRQGITLREAKEPPRDHTASQCDPQGLGFQSFGVRGLLSPYWRLGAGGKAVTELRPCPLGRDSQGISK